MKYALIIGGGAIVVFPICWALLTSFKTPAEIQSIPPSFFPKDITNISNYIGVFQRFSFLRYLLNSLLITSICASCSVFFCSLAGYGFAKFNFPFKTLFWFMVIAVFMIPLKAIVLPLYLWAYRWNLTDTYVGIAFPFLISPFGVFLMAEIMRVIPRQYIDAARIDGASEFRIFLQIILPSAKPALATLFTIKFMLVWNELLWPLVVNSDQSKNVIMVGLTQFINIYFREYHFISAGAMLSLIPTVTVFLLFQKFVTGGQLFIGIKG